MARSPVVKDILIDLESVDPASPGHKGARNKLFSVV